MSIAPGTVYRFVGQPGQYVMGLPARDLTAADVLEAEAREGITKADIMASMLYEPVEWVEIAPFCGAKLADGSRCETRVRRWGARCEEHRDLPGSREASRKGDEEG